MINNRKKQAAIDDVFSQLRTLSVDEFNELAARNGITVLLEDAWKRHGVEERPKFAAILETMKKMVKRDKN